MRRILLALAIALVSVPALAGTYRPPDYAWAPVATVGTHSVQFMPLSVRPLLPGWVSVVVSEVDRRHKSVHVCVLQVSHAHYRMVECYDGEHVVHGDLDGLAAIRRGSWQDQLVRVLSRSHNLGGAK